MENKIKHTLKHGGAVLGTWLNEFRSPSVVVALARSGIDFVLIDAEHSQYGLETIEDLCLVAREVGLGTIVRVPEVSRSWIGRVLDGGAHGLMIPRIKTCAEVEAAVAAAHFPPRGQRGFSLGLANTRFNWVDLSDDAMRQADEEILIVIQIEEREALERLDEMLAVKGVDAAFLGPADLSIALGIPGQMNHPALLDAARRISETCQRLGIAAGRPSDPALFDQHLQEGMRLLVFGGDLYFIQDACQRAMKEFRRLANRPV